MTAAVDANALLSEDFSLNFPDGTTLRSERNDAGYWARVVLTKRIDGWQEHMTKIVVSKERPPAEPTVGSGTLGDGPVADMRRLLQLIESWGGYMFQVRTVDWQCPKIEWVPENDVERAAPHVAALDVHRVTVPRPHVMTMEGLKRLLEGRDVYAPFNIPLSFIRQAGIDKADQRYLSAYFDYYHFIEGLFGDGKSSEAEVVRLYVQNGCLMRSAAGALDILRRREHEQHLVNVRVFLAEERLDEQPEGILRLLVRMRGRLHHYAHKPSPKRRGHPLNELDYESLAFLASAICVGVCTAILVGDALD